MKKYGTGEVLPEPGEQRGQSPLSEEDKERVLAEGQDSPPSSE